MIAALRRRHRLAWWLLTLALPPLLYLAWQARPVFPEHAAPIPAPAPVRGGAP